MITEKENIIIYKINSLNRNSSDKTIEIVYNELFGESDSFICLQPDEIQSVRDYISTKETINFIGGLL